MYIVSSTIDYFDPATKFSALFAVNSQEAHFSPLLKEHRCQAKEEAQQKKQYYHHRHGYYDVISDSSASNLQLGQFYHHDSYQKTEHDDCAKYKPKTEKLIFRGVLSQFLCWAAFNFGLEEEAVIFLAFEAGIAFFWFTADNLTAHVLLHLIG